MFGRPNFYDADIFSRSISNNIMTDGSTTAPLFSFRGEGDRVTVVLSFFRVAGVGENGR